MSMISNVNGRRVISCRKAAELLNVTMGRVRQMVQNRQIWSDHVTERALILDEDEIRRLAKLRQKAREAGIMPGRPPGGFKPDRKAS